MKTFFVLHQTSEMIDGEWSSLMHEIYILKKHVSFSLFELKYMTSEERSYILKKINEDKEAENQLANL